jgi:hypothetical protein
LLIESAMDRCLLFNSFSLLEDYLKDN